MTGASFEALNPRQMYGKVVETMIIKATRPPRQAFLLSVMAGLFIGLGFVYCAVANVTGAGKIVGGLVFSLGLMLVVVLGGDLFTSTTVVKHLTVYADRRLTFEFINGLTIDGTY